MVPFQKRVKILDKNGTILEKGQHSSTKNGTISEKGKNSSTKLVSFQSEKGRNSSTKLVPF